MHDPKGLSKAISYLIREESELAFLAVERWPIVDHLWMDFHFVDPLHVVAELLQVLDVTITDFTNDKASLAGPGLAGLGGVGRGASRSRRGGP